MSRPASNGSVPGLSTDELRAAVRAVIREVLPDGLPGAGPVTLVAVSSDAELDTLVRRVAMLCEDPDHRAAFTQGRHGFRLAAPAAPAAAGQEAQLRADFVRVERGAVTERVVANAAKAGSRLILGPRAVVTPLARDRARVLGVDIEREH